MTAKELARRAHQCLDQGGQHGSKVERCILLYSRLKGYTGEDLNRAACRRHLDTLIRGMGEAAWSDLGKVYTAYGERLCLELMTYVARLGGRDTKAMSKALASAHRKRQIPKQ